MRRGYWAAPELLLLIVSAASMVWAGIALRPATWAETEALRYAPDMQNAWKWGSRAARDGYVQLYQSVVDPKRNDTPKDYGLDYVPLRLAVMTLWAKSRLAVDPNIRKWQSDYAFNAPLLHFNTSMELLGALGIFAVARQWSRRDDAQRSIRRRWFRAEWLALIAFGLVWFNPAALLSAHARPTWDAWVLPFFIWAVWFAARGSWLAAGIVLGVGTMLKGQQLVVLPMFILWPLMGFRITAAARFVLGFVLSIGILVSPWIVPMRVLPMAFVLMLALAPLAAWIALRRWPIRGRLMPTSWLRWTIPLSLAIGLLFCLPLFGGSMDWFQVGFVYGAQKFTGLEVGGASSLAGILQNVYGWQATMPVLPLEWIGIHATIAQVMMAVFALCVLLICWGIHRYERAGDARFVLAIAAPWIVYFAVFPQMHERYLLWGALAACAATVVNSGSVLLAIFFSLCSTIMSLYQMLPRNRADEFLTDLGPNAGEMLHDFVRPTFPDIGWAILLGSAVWIWIVLSGALGARLPARAGRAGGFEIIGDDETINADRPQVGQAEMIVRKNPE
ncbi:MAG: hypothetical protein H7144_10955 [Burkholderiales bacterium]|nr:hypothetical protein [Phycisphaerae bacterium]